MHYAIKNILKIIDGQWVNQTIREANIDHILFDSRKVIFSKTALFFAFTGIRSNGHQFIDSLYKKGVRNFVVSRDIPIEDFHEANFIKVDNTLIALQRFAVFHRKQFNQQRLGELLCPEINFDPNSKKTIKVCGFLCCLRTSLT